MLGLVLSPVAFGSMIDSPRKQMAMGTLAEDVVCKEGMALMKRSSGAGACVKPSTAMKLENVGWGMMLKDVMMMDMHREKMMEQKEMMMKDKDMMDNKGMMERGDIAMGFNQTKIMHHFVDTATGGEIRIIALDDSDSKTISEIRFHVEDIQHEFSQGNFTKPFFIHAQVVPGTQIMTEKKDLIQYSTLQIEGGEVLVLTTNDAELLDAIKQFMEFQSSQHMGDEMMDDTMETMTVGGIDISMASPVEGNDDAPITIIEFGDYQCVNCDKWFLNEKPTITSEFLETGKAKMYFLDFPFQGPDSYTASEATWCANEQGKFAEFHDVLYVNQGGLEDGWASPDSQKQFALELGLDAKQFNSCLDSGKFSEQVLYNKQVGISNGVDRTPVFFIVGSDDSIERIDGNQPASVFQKVINNFIDNQ
jgi:protein-disulfide isomerase